MKKKQCIVPGCETKTVDLKAHAQGLHIPSVFDECLPCVEEVLVERRRALTMLYVWLVGRPGKWNDLVQYVNRVVDLRSLSGCPISPVQLEAMKTMCDFVRVPSPKKFRLRPVNAIGVLCHWRVLLVISAILSPVQREFLVNTFRSPADRACQANGVLGGTSEMSHVSPSVGWKEVSFDGPASSLSNISSHPLPEVKIQTENQVVPQSLPAWTKITFGGSVAFYCDPNTYPSFESLDNCPGNRNIAIGLHPQYASESLSLQNSWVMALAQLVKHPSVVALGHVGFDFTEPMKDWSRQVQLLLNILPFLKWQHVLVLYCHSKLYDKQGQHAYLMLLDHLQNVVPSYHMIHLRYFYGTKYVVKHWLKKFPRTHFGFTGLVGSFNPEQRAALKMLRDSQILLESDVPYLYEVDQSESSKKQLFRTAELVADIRGVSVEHILKVTGQNALKLYKKQ
ncbi:uncharacterized protein LOC106167563 isoform X1 [Lingula anatina]|uniref:Uncharacterized protein LOC106167563 isoform X1 n=1 Tax=Lingula anatina TaxID=7574 RepID=A0A1S3IUD0_LINAN|nr:uncharacterized protein LOC106167563 isoform X1 [Lingula anatina]|eukprot:XP_013401815.1 uncharacterized protein LOC106167563 isoform X1 [Lingula anatina]